MTVTRKTKETKENKGKETKKKSQGASSRGANKGTTRKAAASKGKNTKAEEWEGEENDGFLQSEAVIIASFAVCVLLFLSNFHICGFLGNFFSRIMLGVFGCIGYLAPLLLFAELLFYLSNRGNIRAIYKMIAVEVLLIVLCGFAQLILGGGYQEGQTLADIYQSSGNSGLGGGVIGGALVLILHAAVGTIGAYVVLLVFLIISLVCITEKSFVKVVQAGSQKAYAYAKEDYDQRMEVHRERQAEKQRLREEKKVQGVNLAATDFSKNADFGGIAGGIAEQPRNEKKQTTESETKQTVKASVDEKEARQEETTEKYLPSEEKEPQKLSEKEMERKASEGTLDPADVFRGKIFMGAKEEKIVRHDEDIFVSHGESDFAGMGLFPDRQTEAVTEPLQDAPAENISEEERAENRRAVLANIPNIPLDTEEENSFAVDRSKEHLPEALTSVDPAESSENELMEEINPSEDENYWIQTDSSQYLKTDAEHTIELTEIHPVPSDMETESYGTSKVQSSPQAPAEEFQEESDEIPEQIQTLLARAESDLAKEEKVKPQQDEHRQIITSSGKVIETDTETIVRQKLEERRIEKAEREEAGNEVLQEIRQTEEKPKKPYVIPPLELLKKGVPITGQSEQEFKDTAIKLQQTLRNFGVGVTVTNISCGPTVTRYELHPEQGVKVSKILALSDDIKLNLAAADIRIEAPIPGKAAVGIEVPNKVVSMVYLRDLLESDAFKNHTSNLAFAVGKDIGGQVIVADLAKMPHLLIAGQTGSGKSVGINTMIMSLIYRSSPEDVKLIMIDPKVVELSVYNGIPHLLIPVVTDPKKAAGALNWAVAEMMDRYNKFAASNVRDIKGYNAKIKNLEESGDVPKDQIPKKLPKLVIIIDELADLMMVASNEVEDAICRLAQLARAAGIHLVIATQRPSVNVITGVIKANVPSRIAFSVASGVDSRTILDMVGAEKLLGNGDMLFYPSGYSKPLRVQGAFVSDGEVSNVTEFLKEQNEDAGYNTEIEKKLSQSSLSGSTGSQNERDALFTDAGKFIIEKDKASIGMLQRMFKIGFNRAARIMDQLAEAGVVGEEEGTKPRKILMSMEEFEEFLEAGY